MNEEPVVMSPSWPLALLVCKDCRKRSNGPSKLKPKAVAAALKRATHLGKPRPRVVLTSCLGPCPKRAMTVAAAGGLDGPRVALVSDVADIERVMPRLLPGPKIG